LSPEDCDAGAARSQRGRTSLSSSTGGGDRSPNRRAEAGLVVRDPRSRVERALPLWAGSLPTPWVTGRPGWRAPPVPRSPKIRRARHRQARQSWTRNGRTLDLGGGYLLDVRPLCQMMRHVLDDPLELILIGLLQLLPDLLTRLAVLREGVIAVKPLREDGRRPSGCRWHSSAYSSVCRYGPLSGPNHRPGPLPQR
jgi:hypothetical protein